MTQPFNDFGFMELCGSEFEHNLDPSTGWRGSVFCTLFPGSHEDGKHIGFTPAGNPRVWTDVQARVIKGIWEARS